MPGVYISYPFCAQKCTYCNFASGVFPKALEGGYQQRLLEQIRGHDWEWTPETVYLGGGTPSLWPLEELREVLKAVPGNPWREATLEAAPGSLTDERIAAWCEAGINRVSLGVQSFVDVEIRRSGRKHTAEVVREDVARLRKHGIEAINLDLISGLAGQTQEGWRVSLEQTLELATPHVSVYMLEVDEDSRLGQEVLLNGKRYGAPDIPSEALQVEFYEQAVEQLGAAGIARYEISNFARPGAESLHNLKYWKLEPYVGFGADAHSFDGEMRWRNADSPQEFIEQPLERQELEEADTAGERYWVGLRLMEGVEDGGEHVEWVNRMISDNLLERTGSRIRLTPRGVIYSNEVFEGFLSARKTSARDTSDRTH